MALWPVAGRPQTQLAAPSVGRAWPPLNCGRVKACTRPPAFLVPTLRLLQGAECDSTLMGGGVGRERLGRTGAPGGPRVLGSSEPLLERRGR